MRILDKKSFTDICGNNAPPKDNISSFNDSEFQCVCGNTHMFHENHIIHICFEASEFLKGRLVVFCPEKPQHFTLIETRMIAGFLPDGFVSIAGYIEGNKNFSSNITEYIDTLCAEQWIQALWNWEDRHEFSFFPRNKHDLINLDKLYLGHFMYHEMDLDDKIIEIPEEICKLPNLKHLILGSVSMPEVFITALQKLPDGIGQLTYLESLYVQFNQLQQLPVTIGNLFNLKDLKLGGNNLRRIPKEIGNLSNLEILTLWDNNLTELPSEIGKLKQLMGLDISHNPLKELPDEITELTNLQRFYLNTDILLTKSQLNWFNKLKENGCEFLCPCIA